MSIATQGKPELLRVVIHRSVDQCPDASYLGEYTRKRPSEADLCRHSGFDRAKRDDMLSGVECRYWTPANSVAEHRASLARLGYSRGDAEERARSYVAQDYARSEALSRGEWCFCGVWAEAEIIGPDDTLQSIRSGGLWGLESDMSESDFATIEAEQMSDLRRQLRAFGLRIGRGAEIEHREG